LPKTRRPAWRAFSSAAPRPIGGREACVVVADYVLTGLALLGAVLATLFIESNPDEPQVEVVDAEIALEAAV
jgi:hypothetical protein